MHTVLFVDDEQAVLDAMRAVFAKHRREWRMVFACGPQAALAMLAREPFDAVVTDLAMLGMDGATLLERVQAMQPRAVRIVLSGNADSVRVAHAAEVCDEVLAKPCTSAALMACLARRLAPES